VTSTSEHDTPGLQAQWVVPDNWFVVPRDTHEHERWAADTAAALGRSEAMANLIEAAGMLQSDDPTVSPFVAISDEEPYIDATGWLRAWDGTDGMVAVIDQSFAELSAPQPGLYHSEIIDVDIAGPGTCRALYTFQASRSADEVLEERVCAFLVDDTQDLVRQVTFVTTDVAAFDDPVGLAVEVLERSASGADQ
jgi:hypothetical protein